MNQIKQLNIKNAEAYELAAELASLTGESLTAVVVDALKEKLERETHSREQQIRLTRLLELARLSSSWPNNDQRTPDEILGYDENGLPT